MKTDLVLDFSFPELIAPFVESADGEGPIADIIAAGMWAAVDTLAQSISMETPVNFGHLSGAISQAKTVEYGQSAWTGTVSDGGVTYGWPVEYGRPPGPRMPLEGIASLELWVKRKGLQWTRKLKSGGTTPMTANQMAWAIAVHISKHGQEGKFMFREGLRLSTPAIDQIFASILDDIATMWGAAD